MSFQRNPCVVERPASGDDIYVCYDDLVVYFDAAVHVFGKSSATCIEAHLGKEVIIEAVGPSTNPNYS